ncbi:MAG: hypothetical protein LBK75_08740 [Oscillospiraceae bacterium]|jgi:hypothetical protein|nr:hypothetical protein [Oscillospiraceae bacterium]
MYNWTSWLDHVTLPANCFKITDNGDGTATITPAGTVMQQGTSQDQAHFNNIEAGVIDAHAAVQLLSNAVRQNTWAIEIGRITLTNTEIFPFNNSQKTISLSGVNGSDSYIVLTRVTAFRGNVGEIEVSDRLRNGFKVAFTGSGASATVEYTVMGGYLK